MVYKDRWSLNTGGHKDRFYLMHVHTDAIGYGVYERRTPPPEGTMYLSFIECTGAENKISECPVLGGVAAGYGYLGSCQNDVSGELFNVARVTCSKYYDNVPCRK